MECDIIIGVENEDNGKTVKTIYKSFVILNSYTLMRINMKTSTMCNLTPTGSSGQEI